MNNEKLSKQEDQALHEAIATHFNSPALMQKVLQFAHEQDLYFTKYVPYTALFVLSDGEGYTAEAILEYFSIDTAGLILPAAVDAPEDKKLRCEVCGEPISKEVLIPKRQPTVRVRTWANVTRARRT